MLEAIWDFILANPGITIVGAVTLIQIAPIKVDPWNILANWFKTKLVGSIENKLDKIQAKVGELEERVKEDKALQARTHILRFADELYEKKYHSKEYFEDVLDEVDMYEKYCNTHPDFKNNKTVMSADLIKSTYRILIEEHKF